MSVELASAYISLVPSAKGIGAAIASELGGPLEAAAIDSGNKTSKGFGGAFTSGLKTVGVAAAGVLVAGFAGVAGLAKIGSTFDDAFDQIRIGTGKTGDELKGLEGDFKTVFSSVPVSADDAAKAITTLTTGLGLSGKPLEDLSTQVLNLSRMTKTDLGGNLKATSDLFNSWGVAAGDQGPKLDELFRISQSTGIGVGDLASSMAESGPKFRAAGLSFEESGALLGLLAKNGLSASDVLPAISKAMATAAKEGKPAAQVFQDTFDAIKNAPSDTDAAAAAIGVFGAKAGPQFAALIREGKLSYEDFAASVAAGGDTINAAASETDDWKEKLQLLGNKVLVALEPVASKVFDGITKAVIFLTPYIAKLSAWLSENLPKAIAAVSAWFQAHLVPVLKAVGEALGKAFGFIMDHKEILVGILVALGVAMAAYAVSALAGAAATVVAMAPFIAIGVAIAAVVAAVIYAYTHFEVFRNVVQAVGRFLTDEFWPALQTVFNGIVTVVQVAFGIVQGIIEGAVAVIQAIWSTFGDAILTYITGVWDLISGVFQGAFDALTGIFNFFKDLFTGNWSKLWDDVKQILSGAWDIIKALVQGAIDTVTAILQAAWDAIKLAASTAWDLLKAAAGTAWDLIKSAITAPIDAAKDLIGGVWDTIKSAAQTGWDLIKSAADTAWGAIKDAVMTPINLVKDLIKGVWDTVKSDAESVWNAIKDVISAPINAIKGFIQGLIDKVQGIIDKAIAAKNALLELNPFNNSNPDVKGKVGFASGTPSAPPGLRWVGERGPELMGFLGGETVIPHLQSVQLASNLTGAGGGPLIGHAEFHNDVDVDGFFRIAQFLQGAAA